MLVKETTGAAIHALIWLHVRQYINTATLRPCRPLSERCIDTLTLAHRLGQRIDLDFENLIILQEDPEFCRVALFSARVL